MLEQKTTIMNRMLFVVQVKQSFTTLFFKTGISYNGLLHSALTRKKFSSILAIPANGDMV